MATTTPLAQYPYPTGEDPVDVPADLERLARALDSDPAIRRIYATQAALNAAWAPVDGAHAFTIAELAEWQRRGGAWVPAIPDAGPAPVTPNLGTARVTYNAITLAQNGNYVASIVSLSDPNNLITQADTYAIKIDKAGIYALNFAATGTNTSNAPPPQTIYTLQTPGSTTARQWTLRYQKTRFNMAWTGRVVANQSFRLALQGGQYGVVNAGQTVLDIYPVTLS